MWESEDTAGRKEQDILHKKRHRHVEAQSVNGAAKGQMWLRTQTHVVHEEGIGGFEIK